ncbi:hypothetical protein BH11PSE2_BH11PSE2_10050 [soil metagenome]
MAEIVSLSRARKVKAKTAEKAAAAANRAAHGRTKAERALENARKDKESRDLDGAKRET